MIPTTLRLVPVPVFSLARTQKQKANTAIVNRNITGHVEFSPMVLTYGTGTYLPVLIHNIPVYESVVYILFPSVRESCSSIKNK
jgi:hypothetical protein